MNNLQSNTKNIYIYGRDALEQKMLAWRPVRVLAATIHSLAAPDRFINRSEVDGQPLWESKQWYDHQIVNNILKSASWDTKHVVTRRVPLRVPQYTSPHRVHRKKVSA